MRVMRSDRRKRRSGQTSGLYFVVKSGDGAPRDNQATFCSKFQADVRDPSSSWRRGHLDGRREGCQRPHRCRRRGHHRGGRPRPKHPPRARGGARPPATDTAGARSAAAPKRRPPPPSPQRTLAGVPAEAAAAPVRLHVTFTDRGARRPAPPEAAPPVARDMA